MKKWIAGVAALVLSISLVGCGASGGSSSSFKVGLATDVGGKNDGSFNAAAVRGLDKLTKDLGVKTTSVESAKQDDYQPNLSNLSSSNDLTWAIGFLMHDATDAVAKAQKDKKFAIIDSVVDAPNVASVTFREQEGSFLMGVIAAKATKSKKIGFVGGMAGDLIGKFEAGFRAGVKSIDPAIPVSVVYAESFVDDAKGKQIATQMFGSGIDVIYHASGNVGKGVIQAAAAAKKYAIGVDSDQNSMAPEYVISSMIKKVDEAVFQVSKDAKDGKFAGGKAVELGLKQNGVGYAPSTLWKTMPDGTQKLVDAYAKAIVDGKIMVPSKPGDVAAFTPVKP